MKRILALAAISAAALFAAPTFATDSVQVGGITFTCTNTCSVSTSNGVTTVRDCCGGRVSTTFSVPQKIEE